MNEVRIRAPWQERNTLPGYVLAGMTSNQRRYRRRARLDTARGQRRAMHAERLALRDGPVRGAVIVGQAQVDVEGMAAAVANTRRNLERAVAGLGRPSRRTRRARRS